MSALDQKVKKGTSLASKSYVERETFIKICIHERRVKADV